VGALQGAIAAVERRHADELREELQDTRDLCTFIQQENEELNMVSMLYQRQLEQVKQQMAAAKPVHGEALLLDVLLRKRMSSDTPLRTGGCAG
jgi:hypothetical protein